MEARSESVEEIRDVFSIICIIRQRNEVTEHAVTVVTNH